MLAGEIEQLYLRKRAAVTGAAGYMALIGFTSGSKSGRVIRVAVETWWLSSRTTASHLHHVGDFFVAASL